MVIYNMTQICEKTKIKRKKPENLERQEQDRLEKEQSLLTKKIGKRTREEAEMKQNYEDGISISIIKGRKERE